MVGGSCGDDGSVVGVGMLGMDASISPVGDSSGGIACSTKEGPCDGSVGSNGIGMVCSEGGRIPRYTQMLLYLPKDGSMLGLGGDNLLLPDGHVELSSVESGCSKKWSMSAKCDIGL